jgi:hypothetical protein
VGRLRHRAMISAALVSRPGSPEAMYPLNLWREPFEAEGLARLYGRQSGRTSPTSEARIPALTRQALSDGSTRWRTRKSTRALEVQHTVVARLCRRAGLKPPDVVPATSNHRLTRAIRLSIIERQRQPSSPRIQSAGSTRERAAGRASCGRIARRD